MNVEAKREEQDPDLSLKEEIATLRYTIWKNEDYIKTERPELVNYDEWRKARIELPKKVIEVLKRKNDRTGMKDVEVLLHVPARQLTLVIPPSPQRNYPTHAFVRFSELEKVHPGFISLLTSQVLDPVAPPSPQKK